MGAVADTFCHGSGGCSQSALASKALTLGFHHSSCLAHSNGIPGSVPSDCRLAPLPPSFAHTHTHTHKPAPQSAAVPLIFITAQMWDSESFAYRLLTLHIRLLFFVIVLPQILQSTFTAPLISATLPPPADHLCVLYFSLSLSAEQASLVKRRTRLFFSMFPTCKNTTKLSLLTCVLRVDTTLAHTHMT